MDYLIGIIDDEQKIAEYNKVIIESEDDSLKINVYKGDFTNSKVLEWILDNQIKCLITDYTMHNVTIKNGIELAYYINNILQDFPCVVLTAFEDDANKRSRNLLPNIKVYEKEVVEEDDEGLKSFTENLKILMDSFENRIDITSKRYADLLAKYKGEELPIEDLKELKALDKILKAYNYIEEVPLEARSKKLEDMMDKMLKDIKKLNEN